MMETITQFLMENVNDKVIIYFYLIWRFLDVSCHHMCASDDDDEE